MTTGGRVALALTGTAVAGLALWGICALVKSSDDDGKGNGRKPKSAGHEGDVRLTRVDIDRFLGGHGDEDDSELPP